MMINSPEALRKIGEAKRDKPAIQDAYLEKARNDAALYPDLWDAQGKLNFAFFEKPDTKTLEKWKEENHRYADDLTCITISADTR